jgi:5-dehydro-2-deoxygluconokinase
MTRGFDQPLYVMPFDHRGSFQTGLFGWKPPLSDAQTAEIASSKQIIYDGFLAALAGGAPVQKAAILVDEQFGAAILRQAKRKGILTACPAEKSGQEEFDFEYWRGFRAPHRGLRPDLLQGAGALQPGGRPRAQSAQAARLKRLSDYLRGAKRSRFMFELLVPRKRPSSTSSRATRKAYDLEVRPRLMVEAIRELQAPASSRPWKIEGLDRREDCAADRGDGARRRRDHVGCIVLGRGEDDRKVREWLDVARQGAGLHRLCRRPHGLLGSACRLDAGKATREQAGRPDREPLTGIRKSLRGKVTVQLGMIGLGRMGANMVRRLIKGGHECVVFDMSAKAVAELVKEKAVGTGFAGGVRQEARQAARGLADGAGGRGRQEHRRSAGPSRARRHPDRWRQLVLRR